MRGEIWTSTGEAEYAGEPRPVVIIQDGHFERLDSIVICGFTSDPTDLPLFRISIEPSGRNGLKVSSRVMVDKILTVRKSKLGYYLGRLDERDVTRLDQALAIFLGLAE